jgi:hypothetical protein
MNSRIDPLARRQGVGAQIPNVQFAHLGWAHRLENRSDIKCDFLEMVRSEGGRICCDFNGAKILLEDKERFELKGAFEEEAPLGSIPQLAPPFACEPCWGTALKSISDIDVGCYVAS